MKSRSKMALGLTTAAALVLAACGDDGAEDADTAAAETAETAEAETAEPAGTTAPAETGEPVCPSELVIQTDWFPELEHGGTYQLIGPNGTADKDTVSYSGPVQPQYAVPGLETITIRTINFDKNNVSQLLDGDADMAYIGTADVIANAAGAPLVSIMKTLDKDPQMIMWDPAQNPVEKPEDIAASGARVLHFPGPPAYISYMIGKGYMTEEQSDPSYDGSDAKWVADAGNYFQQGFATNEVYKYENEINWKDGAPAPVDFYTVGDLGFDNYPAAITMLASRVEELDACLTQLVPKMAQAWVDYFNDPKPITDALIEINVVHDGFWGLSEGLNTRGLEILEEKGIGDNSPDGTYCTLDPAKVQAMYDLMKPILEEQGVEVVADVTTTYTNKYCEGAPGR